MKANEAPDKIYCTPAEGGLYFTTTKPEPPFAEGVEYTRTDAFIEKACAWLEDNYPYYFETSIKEDFKKYMKGE